MVYGIATELMITPAETKNGGQRKGKAKVAKGTNSKSANTGVGKTAMSKGVGSSKNNEASQAGKAVARVKTKGTTDKVASLSMKKNPSVKGPSKPQVTATGQAGAQKGAGPGRGAAQVKGK